jgi:hypothetical protein
MASELNFDENLKKLEEAIAERRKKFCQEQQYPTYICGATMISGCTEMVCEVPRYVNAYDAQGRSCAKVSAAYQPNYERHDDWSNATIDYLRSENQRITQNIQKVIAQNAQLVDEINRLRRENAELKNKKAKKKDFDVAVYGFFNKVGIGAKSIYQDVINWFNT